MVGIADYLSNKGFRSKIEKETSLAFIDALFRERDATHAMHIIDTGIKKIVSGGLPQAERSVVKKRQRHALQYSVQTSMKTIGGALVDGLSRGQTDVRPYSDSQIFTTLIGSRGKNDEWDDGTLTSIIHAALPFEPMLPYSHLLNQLYNGLADDAVIHELGGLFAKHANNLTNGTARL